MRQFKIKDRAEFEKRQMPLFDFVTNLAIKAARDIAEHIAATVSPWWKAFQERMAPKSKKPHQLIIECDLIAQIPLIA